jgi:metallo-beta-lactamase family protein
MQIKFNGAARTVTGSQFVLTINGKKLLLECGLFQGKRQEFFERNQSFPFQVNEIDACILSHAHIDHSGNLPHLVKLGYNRDIFVTPPTEKLGNLVLLDSGHIHEADAEFINKKHLKRSEPLIEPLYTRADAAHVAEHFRPKDYDQPFEPIPGVTARFVDAGHILGSASICLDVRENGRSFRFWFSGDIGRRHLPLVCDPVMPEGVDYLMMECTYGDKVRSDHSVAYEELRAVVERTIRRRGKVIIPSFAIGRTQELVYDLNQMFTNGEIPRIPIFVDSPLAVEATKIFQQFSDYFDDEAKTFARTGQHPALSFAGLTYIQSAEESKALNERHEPMVIISASGMAETGRILHHLKNNIENPANTILIVSWQAPNTLGRRLAEKETEIKIFGEFYQRRAEVATIGGFSAHADQTMLRDYALAARSQVKKIFLVHGEPRSADPLRQILLDEGIPQVEYPDIDTSVDID